MRNLCVFCAFSTFAQKILKGWGCNFRWSFGKVLPIKSMKMVFVARINRHKLYMIYTFFDFFFKKTFLIKNIFLTAEINLTTRGPSYTCLVVAVPLSFPNKEAKAAPTFAGLKGSSKQILCAFDVNKATCFWFSHSES